jgi:flagellar protein FlgJ
MPKVHIDNQDILKIEKMQKTNSKEEEFKKIAKEYESIMISKSLKQMHENIKPDPLLGGGNAEQIYRDMLLDEYGKVIAEKGGIGLQESIVRDMYKIEKR